MPVIAVAAAALAAIPVAALGDYLARRADAARAARRARRAALISGRHPAGRSRTTHRKDPHR